MKTSGLFCLIMVVGCSQVETSEVEQASGNPCPPWLCLNSPELLLHGMHELNLRGEPNRQGLALELYPGTDRAAIYSNGVAYELSSFSNRFRGQRTGDSLEGPELLGAELRVQNGGDPAFTMQITSVREMLFSVGEHDTLEVYRLSWSTPYGALGETVCNGGLMAEEGEVNGMLEHEVLIFTGDRIDPSRLTIDEDPEHAWVTFGCAGHTIAKLHQTRNTTSSNGGDPDGNQATLKMLAGDYCGTGEPITVPGTPLRWKGGLVQEYPIAPGPLEARWSRDGALCVNELRLVRTPSPYFPFPWEALDEVCGVSLCEDLDPRRFDGADRVSALPW